MAFASLKIQAAALTQYSGFKSLDCRTVVRLQENPSLSGTSDFHMCRTWFIRRGSYFIFLFWVWTKCPCKTLGAKVLASKELCSFPRKVIIKIVGMCE